MVTTIEKYPLEKRKIIKKTIKATFSLYVLSFILFSIGSSWYHFINKENYEFSPIINFLLYPFFEFLNFLYEIKIYLIILLAIYPIFKFLYEVEYFKTYFYDVREGFLIIKKGVFMPRETILPYEKIQDVYVDQDLFDRIFNLYDVHVSTATILSGIEAHIDGVNKKNAEAIREIILENIRKSKMKS
ncbi:MAG: PH domain-containing protein [Candidatus Aenigmatarchaeota archaeon]